MIAKYWAMHRLAEEVADVRGIQVAAIGTGLAANNGSRLTANKVQGDGGAGEFCVRCAFCDCT